MQVCGYMNACVFETYPKDRSNNRTCSPVYGGNMETRKLQRDNIFRLQYGCINVTKATRRAVARHSSTLGKQRKSQTRRLCDYAPSSNWRIIKHIVHALFVYLARYVIILNNTYVFERRLRIHIALQW